MIIRLDKSQMFTIDPDVRFAMQYSTEHGTWKEIFRRYKLLDYSPQELLDFCVLKTNKTLTHKTMRRWLDMTEIYILASSAKKKGALQVVSSFFGDYEQAVLDEVMKHMKSGNAKSTRSLV